MKQEKNEGQSLGMRVFKVTGGQSFKKRHSYCQLLKKGKKSENRTMSQNVGLSRIEKC